MAVSKNPIHRRLDRVSDQWVEFAERRGPRLLCWRACDDERPMLDAFLAVESDADAGSQPDLFVRLTAPFRGPEQFGAALTIELVGAARALEQGLGEDVGVKSWSPPSAERGESALALFLRAAVDFARHHALPGHLALWLSPGEVSDVARLEDWLGQAARQASDPLRFIVVDDVLAPALGRLVSGEPELVCARDLALDMPRARAEISEAAGGQHTPGGQYRNHYLQLGLALGARDLDAATAHGQAATAIALAQGWFALQVPVHLALGAAQAGEGHTGKATPHYLSAEAAATAGELAGDEACKKLRVQVRLARGSLLLSAGAYAAAAELFISTIPLASAANEPRLVIDAYRLASFCHEGDGKPAEAWGVGIAGLRAAADMDSETLQTSTLSYLGEGLLRLAPQRKLPAASRDDVEKQLSQLLGPDAGRANPNEQR